MFFCVGEGWESDWDHLPDEIGDILSDMGGALPGAINHPEIATNFDCLPEQLLVRIRSVKL